MKNFIFGATALWAVLATCTLIDLANEVNKLKNEAAINRMGLLNDMVKVMLAKTDKEKSEE